MIKMAFASAAVAITAAVTFGAPLAHADQFGPNCATDQVRRGFLGLDLQTRTICDTPPRPDGSWGRTRTFWYPAHYVKPSSSCSYGTYSSHCTYDEGGYVDDKIIEQQKYDVFPDNVLPDEPGRLG